MHLAREPEPPGCVHDRVLRRAHVPDLRHNRRGQPVRNQRLPHGRVRGVLRRPRTHGVTATPFRVPSSTVWSGRRERRLLPLWFLSAETEARARSVVWARQCDGEM